jgi:flagellum-specific peptidoglycan hydrolase FlgJ
VRSLDQFTPLLQLDGPVQGRVEVRVYRSDFLAVADRGWVSLDDVGPALAPATRVVAAFGGYPRSSLNTGQTERPFLDVAAEAAMASSARTGVPASVTVAQAILESDWGRSSLSRSAGNYFGMKAIGGLGNDGVVWMPTTEYDEAGALYETLSPFRAYKSLTDSMLDHDLLLRDAPRYAAAMQVRHDPRQFAHMLVQGGYATDPAYADKLIALMDRYDLYRLDA